MVAKLSETLLRVPIVRSPPAFVGRAVDRKGFRARETLQMFLPVIMLLIRRSFDDDVMCCGAP